MVRIGFEGNCGCVWGHTRIVVGFTTSRVGQYLPWVRSIDIHTEYLVVAVGVLAKRSSPTKNTITVPYPLMVPPVALISVGWRRSVPSELMTKMSQLES